jgi:hypothetical protein
LTNPQFGQRAFFGSRAASQGGKSPLQFEQRAALTGAPPSCRRPRGRPRWWRG